jgi:hypothetical protein
MINPRLCRACASDTPRAWASARVNVLSFLVLLKVAFESEGPTTSLKIRPGGGQSKRKTRKSLYSSLNLKRCVAMVSSAFRRKVKTQPGYDIIMSTEPM